MALDATVLNFLRSWHSAGCGMIACTRHSTISVHCALRWLPKATAYGKCFFLLVWLNQRLLQSHQETKIWIANLPGADLISGVRRCPSDRHRALADLGRWKSTLIEAATIFGSCDQAVWVLKAPSPSPALASVTLAPPAPSAETMSKEKVEIPEPWHKGLQVCKNVQTRCKLSRCKRGFITVVICFALDTEEELAAAGPQEQPGQLLLVDVNFYFWRKHLGLPAQLEQMEDDLGLCNAAWCVQSRCTKNFVCWYERNTNCTFAHHIRLLVAASCSLWAFLRNTGCGVMQNGVDATSKTVFLRSSQRLGARFLLRGTCFYVDFCCSEPKELFNVNSECTWMLTCYTMLIVHHRTIDCSQTTVFRGVWSCASCIPQLT